jgi:hypothetical protein
VQWLFCQKPAKAEVSDSPPTRVGDEGAEQGRPIFVAYATEFRSFDLGVAI